jgi:COMPASS component SWD2|tara:strand:+ start:1539 stop:2372 length:834 start_codon:yes stop_codon:yes gene_type:complete
MEATYGVGQVFKKEEGEASVHASVNSISFHKDGEFFVTASDDGVIELYDSLKARRRKAVKSTARGARLIQCTHHTQAVLYASSRAAPAGTGEVSASSTSSDPSVSTKEAAGGVGDINYHSLYDNRFIRHLVGNDGLVTSLAMSPVDDALISTSEDNTMRMWDLRENRAVGVANLPPRDRTSVSAPRARAAVAFDPSGAVFALWSHDAMIRLYDARNWSDGPFQTWNLCANARVAPNSTCHKSIDRAMGVAVESLHFSPDGDKLLLATTGSALVVLNA